MIDIPDDDLIDYALSDDSLRLNLDELHPAQRAVYEHPARFKVLNCGRRFGKTALAKRAIIDSVLKEGKPVGVFAPTYKNIAEVWRSIRSTLEPVTTHKSEQEKYIQVITGGSVDFWSLDSLVSLRGRKYKLAIIDEAATIRDPEYFNAVIRPTLADYKGDAWFLSTPAGRNHFWQMYNLGLKEFDGEWASFHYPTASNPYIEAAEIESARRQMPDRLFRQEFLAEFLDDGGGVFRNIRQCIYGKMQENRNFWKKFVIGVDLGKHNDFTVFAVIDPETSRLVWYERFNQIDYSLQLQRLKALCTKYPPAIVIIERNIGEMFIEQAKREELPVRGFQTTHPSKQVLIDSLALAFEQETLSIPDDEILLGELESYEIERLPGGVSRLPGGTFRYSAPYGLHDDCVIALALAWYGVTRGSARAMMMDAPFLEIQ